MWLVLVLLISKLKMNKLSLETESSGRFSGWGTIILSIFWKLKVSFDRLIVQQYQMFCYAATNDQVTTEAALVSASVHTTVMWRIYDRCT